MLALLNIQNLALIEKLGWQLEAGLSCISGETGAGKSVLVGALKLLLGERADKTLLRSGSKQCLIEGVFRLEQDSMQLARVQELLAESGIGACEDGELIIRRIIGTSASRQFVNDSPATLQLLRELSSYLVDMHAANAQYGLMQPRRQLQLLDAYAGNQQMCEDYRQAYAEWLQAQKNRQQALEASVMSPAEQQLLAFQCEEIEAAMLQPEEDEILEDRWQLARNAWRLQQAAARAHQSLREQFGDQLQQLQRNLGELERFDAQGSRALLELFAGVQNNCSELEGQLCQYAENLQEQLELQQQLEQRLDVLNGLKRKYGGSLEAVLEHAAKASARLHALAHREELLAALEQKLQGCEELLQQCAARLGAARGEAAARLGRDIMQHLSQLGFVEARFEVVLQPLEQPGAEGCEQVEYMFGPNKGEPLLPLRMIASSGEMARVMLALKCVLAQADKVPLLVFDEIDANVGGQIALQVGLQMKKLAAAGQQVIAISHFPQVAALADWHFLVSKHSKQQRTYASLRLLESGESRVAELVRMLGVEGTSARAHAEDLLRRAGHLS